MDDYGPSTYGDRIADVYDEWPRYPHDEEEAAEFLASVAGAGSVLELGIGTGRIALPLAAKGVEVHGIDASEAMVAKLRAKPGGAGIPITIGDFAGVGVDGRFSLIFVAFNTFFGLLTQEDQVGCFRNVAARLTDDGVFVIQAFVPDLSRFDRGQRIDAGLVEPSRVMLDVSVHNAAQQRVDAAHLVVGEEGTRIYPVRLRFAYPSELDLMAQLAGLRLRERWSGWKREPYGSDSTGHVSVWERAPG